VNFRQLEYFVAVADELHFGRAAGRLGIAQPPLSQQIRRLEVGLKMQLFHRTKRHVELTTSGRMFLKEARSILAHVDSAMSATVRLQHGEAGILSIGWAPWSDLTSLPAMVGKFCALYPDVHLQMHNMSVSEQVAALASGRIDVGFLVRPCDDSLTVPLPGVTTEAIALHPLIVALPRRHRLASRRRLTLADLAREPYILFKRDTAPLFYDYVISLYQRESLPLNVRHEAEHPSTMLGLVAAGIGLTLLPLTVDHRYTGVVFRTLAAGARLEIALAWRVHNDSALIQKFRQTIRESIRTRPRKNGPTLRR
jgi:DNA-binding transcriptional LysR family regulator